MIESESTYIDRCGIVDCAWLWTHLDVAWLERWSRAECQPHCRMRIWPATF